MVGCISTFNVGDDETGFNFRFISIGEREDDDDAFRRFD